MKYRQGQGFTLIEVMIVVAIIAILATIAYPSYRDYIIRGRIPEGLALLSNERIMMEKFLADNRSYQVGTVHACARYPISTKYFDVTCDGAETAAAYTLQVTGTSGGMTGFTYTIDQRGNKTTVTLGAGWTTLPSPNDCWLLKRDGSC